MLNTWPDIWCLKSTELIATAIIATNDSSVNRVLSLSIMFNKKVCSWAQVSGTFARDRDTSTWWYTLLLSNKVSPIQMCRVPASADDWGVGSWYTLFTSGAHSQSVWGYHKGSTVWVNNPKNPWHPTGKKHYQHRELSKAFIRNVCWTANPNFT